MSPAEYLALRTIHEGSRARVDERMRDRLMAIGLVAMNAQGRVFVTAHGGRILKAYRERMTNGAPGATPARREIEDISPPTLILHEGELVNILATCWTELPNGARCGVRLEWHRNQLPRPCPDRGCQGFTVRRRAVA